MKRVLIGLVLLLLAVGTGVGLWAWNETRPKEVRGSATVEFVPFDRPGVVARPRTLVLSEPWPTYGYDARRTHVSEEFKLRPPFRRLWYVRSGNILEFPPVVAYGRVLFTQGRGRVFSVQAKTGRVMWRKHYRHCAASSPTVGRGVVYVALMQPYPCSKSDRSAKGFIAAIRVRGGKQLWRFRAGAVESSPLLIRNTLYFGSWDHKLYALNVRTRKLRWTFDAGDELNSSPAYAGGTIYIGSDDGRVYAVNARTGKLRWRASAFSRFGRREYFYATPTIAYGRVYIGNTDGTVYAFGASSGRLLWASRAGSYVYTAAAVWRRTVYVGSYDGNVYAFDAATGGLRWTHDSAGSIHGAPTIVDGLLYFSTCGTCGQFGSRSSERGPRRTYAIDARNGRLVWSFPDGHYSPVVADEERLYLAGSTRVYALAPRSARPPRRATPSPPARSRRRQARTPPRGPRISPARARGRQRAGATRPVRRPRGTPARRRGSD